MKNTLFAVAAIALAGAAFAKIPPPDDAAKAKAAETAAKAGWQAKVDAYQLCKAQDKVAAKYGKGGGKAAAAMKTPAAAAPAASAPTTPVSYAPPPACMDPGPFAYTPPEQKPLETSGAHSPPGTASSPPSVRPEAAKIQPPGKTKK